MIGKTPKVRFLQKWCSAISEAMKTQCNQQRGSVLVTTLVISAMMAIVVAAMLVLVERQQYFTARSKTWCAEIPIAEAGIEEAMAHLNTHTKNLATNGWSLVTSNYVKTRKIGDGYFYTAISSRRPRTIVSIGYGRIPLQTNYTHRTVMVLTKEDPPSYGIVARKTIKLNGSGSSAPAVDSFDSSDPNFSGPGGIYDPLKNRDDATVGTLSSATPAVDTGSGEINGIVATGPGGTVVGTVGDGSWTSTTSGIQPGAVRDDFNLAIPDVDEPTSSLWNPFPSLSGLLNNADYKINGPLNRGFTVSGNVRLWVTGNVKLSGGASIVIMSGGSLELFIGQASGPSVTADLGGNGIVNNSLTAVHCKIWGLPTCTTVKYHGVSALVGVVYAPEAALTINGTSDIYGSFTCDSFSCFGGIGIHQDEALMFKSNTPVTIISWEEL